MLSLNQRERRVSRLNRTGKNTTGWARRLTALLVTACLVMAMALPVYAEVDLLPDAPDEVELLEDEPGTASGENTTPPEQNAATPEPEQSAEPEQPAPTETPEPTAEPAPTPEPAATATATPVPTVTPTATPEPTEQPQKMNAAKSVGNVQAVSEGENTETYTLYFAVPDSWKDYKKVTIYAVDGKSDNDHKYFLEMQKVSETKDHRKIYSVVLKRDDHYCHGGLNGLEFRGYREETDDVRKPTQTIEISKVDVENNNYQWWKTFDPKDSNNYIGGNYYDPEAEGEKWSTYTVTVRHDDFAGKEMVFENKTGEKLTSVHAWFYEPDGNGGLNQVGAPIASNSAGADSGIAPNSTATFTIPNELCSYVKFTWGEDNPQQSSKYYNFYGEDVSGDDKKSFTYNSDTRNCFIYTGVDNERWGIENSVLIYYDATFSKLPTTGKDDTGGYYSIPKDKQSTVYYRLKGENGEKSINGTMSQIPGTDYYAADVPAGYTKILFSSYPLSSDEDNANCGERTDWEDIPSDYQDKEQCFYADTNDDAVYHNGVRGGYWAPKGTPRDAETWKNTDTTDTTKTKVVDIESAPFTEEANTKYVTSTLYDYYTDYELNGKNRDSYGDWTGESHRTWVPFREFDQALSDYYQDAKAPYPIYTGHFQPDNGHEFSQIADTLNLFGYDNDSRKFNHFMAINNSQRNDDNTNGSNHTNYAYQGLVADKTSTGNADGAPLLNGTEKATVEPHFNKEFLLGKNSKNAKLGDVYDNVAFPFTKEQIFNEDQGVDYWYFDSKDTTLYLKQDSEQNSDSKYFLKKSTDRGRSENVNASSGPQGHYGYFPFNETATGGKASTYNYGFGTKLQMDFTLTDDGMVETNKIGKDGKKEKTNIKFFFSGDDDVWVFIDGQLVLDVGGAHGKVSGLLEFGETKDGKNSVTAYVSKVKKGGTAKDNDIDEKTVNSAVKTVKYNGNDIYFYAKNTNLEPLDKGKKHTLTIYYMERGMWESNMAVAFNFPDNNELQVQKEVDLSKVDPDFQKCFTNQKIFNFTIQNQATHYGTKLADGPDTNGTQSQVVNLEASKIEPATPKNDAYIFKLDKNPLPDSEADTKQVLHWYARYMDTEPVSKWRKNRYGILTLEAPINIENERFLTFEVYVDHSDGGDLSLNNLYLELLDENNVQKGSLGTTGINGATYGSVELVTGKWVTVKLDLNKMKKQDNFNNYVKTIRVGDNYSRHIYFRNFTFIPKAVPSTMTGFTTDQKEIPDYGSAKSGNLENAINAQYTSTEDSDTQLVDEDGRFVLEDGETVTFSDQFRRGSYISLKEDLNQNLYDTKWTVYENGWEVNSMSGGNTVQTVKVADTSKSLVSQSSPAAGPDDGRTEVYVDKDGVRNEGYKESKKPDTGTNTIVFRSYKDPDETSSTLTKLKVKYVNTVKTGGLTIQKEAADDEEDKIKGIYTFKVTFSNVGGEGLEDGDIIREYTINMNDPENPEHICTITGIPVGTRYTIEEVKPKDGSRLQSVTVPAGCDSAQVFNNNTMVEGEIKAANTAPITAIFTNTKRTLINIEFDKLWEGTDNLSTANRPDTIYIQLQRRLATSKNDAEWKAVKYPADSTKDYVTIEYGESRWQYTFSGLHQYQINADGSQANYEYRIVEGTVENDKFKKVAPGGTITIKGNTYVVTAEATAKSEKDSETGATTTPATTPDGTITGGSGKIVLTNTLQNPKFVLDIIKKDANDEKKLLDGVEFKLEKLKQGTTEGEPQWVVDKDYQFSSNENKNYLTGTTGDNGEITNNPFKDLKPGRYRLTETKAHKGYNLLSKSIDIEFTQNGECYINDSKTPEKSDTFKPGPNNTYTMTLTVLNRKTPELPHTGADAPSLWLLIGMPLAVAGLLIFTFRYNRKGGRRH